MPLTHTQILTYIGITIANQRNTVADDLIPLPDRLSSLLDETKEGIEDTCMSYTKLGQNDRFRLSRVIVKRLVALMYWVRDRGRLDFPVSFPNGTDQQELLEEIQEAAARDKIRTSQRKLGDSLITATFDTKLKNRVQWERWCVELQALLNTIIGTRGVALSYVIRDPAVVIPNEFTSYEERAKWTAPHDGMEYDLDKKSVHNVIIRNIAEDCDAYIYIKPSLNQENGTEDMRLLRYRYDNAASIQQRINEANKSLSILTYKNERALPFERFSQLLKKAVDTLTECNRTPHDGDLVDGLWPRIQNVELAPFVNALKVQYQIDQRPFYEILQDIASQIPNLTESSKEFRNVSEVSTNPEVSKDISTSTECPEDGAFDEDGKLFIGSYTAEKWKSISVQPHRGKIIKARKNNAKYNKQGKEGDDDANAKWKKKFVDKNKQTISELKAQINELKDQISNPGQGGSQQTSGDNGQTETNSDNNNAGTSFGGRSSRSNSSNNNNNTRASQIKTSARNIRSSAAPTISSQRAVEDKNFSSRCELDSHADTTVAGRNCLLMNYTDRSCTVHAYNDDYDPLPDVPVVKAATGFTSRNGRNYILVLNEALWMPNLDHSLINPNQLRDYGVQVQDNPYDMDPMTISTQDGEFTACLQSTGATIFFSSWSPTVEDLARYPHVILTSNAPWDPSSITFPNITEGEKRLIESRNVSSMRMDVDEYPIDEDKIYNPIGFCKRLINSVKVDSPKYDIRFKTNIKELSSGKVLEEQELEPPKTFISEERHSTVTPEDLSEKWGISVAQAALTLKATTRKLLRSAVMPLARRYRVDRMFGVRRLRCAVSTDTMDARCDSIHGDRYCQVFATKEFFAECYPIAKKSDCHIPLKKFIRTYGAPDEIISDGSREQTGRNTAFKAELRKFDIPHRIIEPERHNQNPAEGVIREVRKKWYRTIFKSNCPRSLWNYGLPHCAAIMNRTASHSGELNGRTPLEHLTGETIDISEYLDFGFWDRVWFKENAGIGETKLGRFLGISHQVGSLMSYWILPESGIPESRTTVQRITVPESFTEANIQRFTVFDKKIATRFKEGRLVKSGDKPDPNDYQDLMESDPAFAEEFNRIFSNEDVLDIEDSQSFTPEQYDRYLSMEVAIDRGGEHPELGTVSKRLKDSDGNPIGKEHNNPILDTRMYIVDYPDGHTEALSANVIAENLFAQVDEQGRRYAIMDQIIDVRTDGNEVEESNSHYTTASGVKRRRLTTKGWEVCVLWKDKSTTWHKLKDIKDSYPVELAEYAHENKVSHKPAFAWWVPHTLKKRDLIISKVKSKYWVRTHKYGIRIPKSVKEAIEIDRENGDSQWWDALMLEMKNVRPAFETFDQPISEIPIGYSKIKCHIIWDVKLGENFRRKARFVAGGHTTEVPSSLTYSSVVSRESVRIALTVAALNDLDILACDIQNAYLTAKCREKVYTIAGSEFGNEEGSVMIIKMALYGLKSSGAAFRSKLASVIWDLGYRPTKADPDVWLRPALKTDGTKYYEIILCYVDDVLSISQRPSGAIEGIEKVFKLKGGKADIPHMYLGCSLSKKNNNTGKECWAISSHDYVKQSITTIEEKIKRIGKQLPKRCSAPLTSGYHPAEDVSLELDADDTQFYQEAIGMLRWAVEIGRIDILLEVALMSQYLANPRLGHLEEVYHIFGYLKQTGKRTIYLDPDDPSIAESRFTKFDWVDFYKDYQEAIPIDAPEPRGKTLNLHVFVDSDHAGDKMSRRSQTGILIFCNRAPIGWISKKQNSVQNSTFGSEFCALKHAVELIEALRYKLRMFGIPVEGPSNVYCDNEAVYKNASTPNSVLNKKHHSIAYHYCRQAVAAGVIRISKEDSKTNLADLFTKILPRATREFLLDLFTY